MKKRMMIILVVFAMLSAMLTGCSREEATITTTVYPVKYIIQQLVGDKVKVELLSSDDFIQRATLDKNYKDILSHTTVFIYIGELEPYMDVYENDFIQDYSFDIINLASLSAIDNFKRYVTTKTNGISVTREYEYYDSDLFDLVDMYNKDPFIWLDPIAMASMASTIKDWLQSYYPEDSLSIEKNFKALQANLVRMDAEYQSLISLDVKVVTVAATFGNWQKAYNVQVYPLILSKYGVLPTAEQLNVIKDTIKKNDVKFIAYDESLPEDMQQLYEEIKTELKLTPVTLSSLSKLSESELDKNKDYMTIMYDNLIALEDAFKKK